MWNSLYKQEKQYYFINSFLYLTEKMWWGWTLKLEGIPMTRCWPLFPSSKCAILFIIKKILCFIQTNEQENHQLVSRFICHKVEKKC